MQFRTLDYNKQNTTRSTLTPEPAQTKSSFIPNKCRLARQLTDETTRPTHPISENSSVDDCSRCLLLQQSGLSFPTNADLPDNLPTRRHAQPITYPKTPRQMTGLAVFCSDKIDFRSRQEQSCPTTCRRDDTLPPTPISENSSANGCSRNFELFSFLVPPA